MSRYDRLGIGYDGTRRPDPRIARRLVALLEPRSGGQYLDIACGTGNYTGALHALGLAMAGVDQSALMLAQARAKHPHMRWHQGDVSALPFADASFDGAVCTNAIHHFANLAQACREIARVVSAGRLVIFTATQEQMRGYWLNHYFPEALRRSIEQMPAADALQSALARAGLGIAHSEPWHVPASPVDLFLYSGKHNPSLYLDPDVRRGISTFAHLASAAEIDTGLRRLRSDIHSGEIAQVAGRHASDRGDYTFIVARKADPL